MTSVPLLLVEEDVENGSKYEANSEIQNDFAYRNNVHNADLKIRMGFLRKVYGLISLQLMMTCVISVVFKMCAPINSFVQKNPWMLGVSFILTIMILIMLHFKRKDHPTNLILLCAFTLIQSYAIGVVVIMNETRIVLDALFITLSIVTGLTAYTFQSKRDFSFLGFGLSAGLTAMLVGGILQIFMQNSALELFMSISGALLFALFIIYDTHMLMHMLSPEEYILAAINIYLDIINLFLHILRALASSQQ